jgi:hypothetical protein
MSARRRSSRSLSIGPASDGGGGEGSGGVLAGGGRSLKLPRGSACVYIQTCCKN